MNFDFIGKRKYFFILSITITLIGLVSFLLNGFVMDVDFKGGTVIQMNMGQPFDNLKIEDAIKNAIGKTPQVQKLGQTQDHAYITMDPLTQDERMKAIDAVKKAYNLDDASFLGFSDVQPKMGNEIRQKGITAVMVASILMLLYIAMRFRVMSGFSAGFTAVLGLVHDLLIMLSVYSLFRIPINGSFIAAALTIIGYSINDTIIVYDRIRENQGLLRKKLPLADLVNKSINQTMSRTINTVVTVVITLVVLFIAGIMFGVQSIKEFTFPLLVGVISGTYSSICISSPLWVMWRDMKSQKKVSAKHAKA